MFVRVLAVAGLLASAAASAQTAVFVNELHYENASTDQNEMVEVAGPAGTDLTGWSIALYNGNGGARYLTMSLSGTIADTCGGFGAISVAAPGIQNGAPDGLALINASGQLVQFISYEGAIVATDGPASGTTSVDIGVSEVGTGLADSSLRLAGTGTTYEDFTWQADAPASFGACNTGQTFAGGMDTPPGVSAFTPGNGATAVSLSTELSVTFTEPVTVTASALALSCSASGAHTAVVSGGPLVYTLDPSTDFSYLETCTLTVVASEVSDLDGAIEPMAANASATFGTEQAIGNYYATADTSGPAALRASLRNLIKDHVRFPYTASATDTWDILDLADEDPLDPTRVLDIYKNASYPKAGAGNSNYNREHTWAKSYGFPDDTSTNWPYTDAHHLMVANSNYNSARNNRYFDHCGSGCTEYPTQAYNGQGGGSGVYPGNSNWGGGGRWEVWNARKGDVARAVMYMDVRYEGGTNAFGSPEPDLVLTDNPALIVVSIGNTTGTAYLGLLSVLVQWSEQDPPDEQERLRNALVQSYQGNRNPFVDHPEWVTCVFQALCATAPDAVLGDGFE